jgi:hypothetical protein
MATAINNGLKANPVELCLFSGNNLYVVPTPTGAVLNQNIAERIQLVSSQVGEEVIANTYVSGQQPEISLTFPSLLAEIMSLKTGRAFTLQNVDTFYSKKLVVPANGIVPAVTTGFDGFGIEENALANAAVLRGGRSVQLVQTIPVAPAVYTPLTAAVNTFNVGENRLLQFSINDGVAPTIGQSLAGQFVSIKVAESLSQVLVLSEESFINFGMILSFVDINLSIWRLTIPSVAVNLTASGNLDFGAEGVEVSFRITYDGTKCTPFDIVRTGKLVKC